VSVQVSPGWRRFTTIGFVLHFAFCLTIASLAYHGALWAHLPAIPHFDTAGHFVLIGGLAFFLDGVLRYRPVVAAWPWVRWGPALVLSVAGIEELAQALTPRRTSSVSDFVADVAGILVLSWLSRRLALRFSVREPKAL